MALGSLIGRGFVAISADTKPAQVTIQALGGIATQVLTTTMLPAVAPVITAVGGIATAFIGAGVAAGAFGAAVKPQLSAVTDAAAQAAAAQKLQEKATVAQQQAHALATKGGVAYENALAKASLAHTRAQQLSISGSKGYKQAQKEAQQATLDAQRLAGHGGTAYAAALAKAKSASQAAKTANDLYKESLKEMPPATRDTAVAFSNLQTHFKDWSNSLAPKTMPVFTLGLEKIQALIPKLTPIVKTASDVIYNFVNDLGDGVAGKVFTSFGKHISDLSGGALNDFLHIGKNIVVGFVGILDAFTPMSSKISGGLTTLTARFAAWGAGAGKNSNVQKFFETAKKEAPAVIRFFSQLATAVSHVAGGLGPLTGIGLKVAETLAKILAALPVSVLNQVVNAIVAINLAMKAYALITGIAGMLTWAFGTATGASRASLLLMRIQLGFLWVQMRLVSVWTAISSSAFWGLAAAILANPITWVVVGIVALIAVIVLIATKTTWFQTAWKYAWNAIKDAALAVWHFLDNDVIHPIASAFVWLWEKGIQPSLRMIVNGFLDMVGTVIHGANTMFGWMPGIGPQLRKVAKEFDAFKDSVNKSLGGVNSRSVAVGVVFSPGQGKGRATFAGGGPVSGPGTGTSDSVQAALSTGEHVWTAREVSAAGGHPAVAGMRRLALAGRTGFAAGGPVGLSVRAVVPRPSTVNRGVLGAVSALAQASASALYAMLAASLGGALPTGSHLAVINAAMAAAGVPPPGTSGQWQSGMNTLIGRESGWNPNAINLTDSNAKAGHPSQGLAQTIPGTFNRYHAPGTSYSITDPVANVAAAIRYIVARYGNITRVQQANANMAPMGYDRGGWLMPGHTMAYNGTGRPERVLGPGQGGGELHVHLHNTGVIGSRRELENWLTASLQELKRTGRLATLLGP